MTPQELKAMRHAMGLKQSELAERLGITTSSEARMEQGVFVITKPMALLIGYVAGEAGVDVAHSGRRRGATESKAADRGRPRDSVRKGRRR